PPAVLYSEPLTFEDVMAVITKEQSAGAQVSCLVQFGGQTPLKLALPLQAAGVGILGTSPAFIDLAEDRGGGGRCRCRRPASRFSGRLPIRSIWRRIGNASRGCSGIWASRNRR